MLCKSVNGKSQIRQIGITVAAVAVEVKNQGQEAGPGNTAGQQVGLVVLGTAQGMGHDYRRVAPEAAEGPEDIALRVKFSLQGDGDILPGQSLVVIVVPVYTEVVYETATAY